MDQQKRAMLYPPIEADGAGGARHGSPGGADMTYEQRASAAASMGLPTEAPPSYDMAIGSAPMPLPSSAGGGWLPAATPPATPTRQPHTPAPGRSVPVVMVQPLPQTPRSPRPEAAEQPTAGTAAATAPTPRLGPQPCAVTCATCGANRTTRVTYTPNTRTHICALVLCLVGWCCCACCVPYCMNSCRTAHHYCAKCNAFLGTYAANPGGRHRHGRRK